MARPQETRDSGPAFSEMQPTTKIATLIALAALFAVLALAAASLVPA